MSEAIAEIFDYDSLHAALRRRAEAVNIPRSAIDEIAGLASGHASKILAPLPIKKLGPVSMGPILETLCCKLLLVEDPAAQARLKDRIADNQRERLPRRVADPIPSNLQALIDDAVSKVRRQEARRRGLARRDALTAEERSEQSRHAAKARWAK